MGRDGEKNVYLFGGLFYFVFPSFWLSYFAGVLSIFLSQERPSFPGNFSFVFVGEAHYWIWEIPRVD